MADVFHLIGIVPKPQRRRGDNYWSSTSHERQTMKYLLHTTDVCFDQLSPETWEMIYDLEDEISRRRNFECKYRPTFA